MLAAHAPGAVSACSGCASGSTGRAAGSGAGSDAEVGGGTRQLVPQRFIDRAAHVASSIAGAITAPIFPAFVGRYVTPAMAQA